MLLPWLGVVCLVLIGGGIGRRIAVPDSIIWCVLGFGMAFVPEFRNFRLDPHLVLLLLLPPLVYASAVRLPWSEFRDNVRPILLLAGGLVLVDTALVAAIAHYLMGFSWPLGAALGALISPTDPVAATAVAARVGIPRKIAAILEGEGLVNDAVALSLLRLAIASAATHTFSIPAGLGRLGAIVIGEPIYGCLVGAVILFIRSRIDDPRLEITVSLLTPFAAYLLPEYLGGSGILAALAAGMYVGERLSEVVPAGTRLKSTSVWQIVEFLLNGMLFLTAGMQLWRVIQHAHASHRYFNWGLLIAGSLVLLRVAWCAIAWALFRGREMLREGDDQPMPARHMVVIAWSGMRGPISLAAALSVPVLAEGAHLPYFDTLLFVTAIVIVVTLVFQGTGLPYLVKALGVAQDTERDRTQYREQLRFGEIEAAKSALVYLSELEAQHGISRELAESLRRERRNTVAQGIDGCDGGNVRTRLIQVERERIRQLKKEGRMEERAVQELERRLDLRQSLLEDSQLDT